MIVRFASFLFLTSIFKTCLKASPQSEDERKDASRKIQPANIAELLEKVASRVYSFFSVSGESCRALPSHALACATACSVDAPKIGSAPTR